MTWFLETPVPAIFIGILLEAVLAVILFRTGRGTVLVAMAAVLTLVLVAVAVEWIVVTDVERVEATLDGAAAALESNNLPAVLAYIAPSAQAMRSQVSAILPQVVITKARIRNLKITVNKFTSPPTAKAEFTANFAGKGAGALQGQFPYENYVRAFTVKLRREGDRWLMTEYQDRDIRANADAR
ncbi:MAG: hypothetical protein ACYC35_11055 [Pirellulales bacterium]